MNDALQAALTGILTETANLYQQGKVFLIEQLPDVIQQLLLWKAIESFIPFMCGVVLLVIYVVGDIKILKWVRTEENSADRWSKGDTWFMFAMGNVICSVFMIPILGFLLTNLKWLQIWVAPKIYLIEYATHLVK